MNVKTVKLALLAASLLAGTVSVASAADLGRYRGPSMKDDPVVYEPAIIWSGFYLGGHVGGGWGNAEEYWYPATYTLDSSGFVGGVHGGYNVQMGHLVLGLEGDWSASGVGLSDGIDERWRASVRGRLGLAYDKALFYVTTGAAWVDFNHFAIKNNTASLGYTLGGGMEYALSPRWSLRSEYLYSDFGTERLGGIDTDYQTHELRAGITYRFGGSRDSLR